MMPIDSGSTLDQRIRTSLFLLMCLAFCGWFGYDGMVSWPAENMKWASQKLPQRPENLKPNPLARSKNLLQIETGSTVEQIRQLLGEPSLELPRTLTFVGREVTATVSIDDQGKVAATRTSPTEAGTEEKRLGILVTKARVELIEKGLVESAVRQLLGEPASVRDRTMWYIGPAAYGEFRLVSGKVSVAPEVQESTHRSEQSIQLQKVIAVVVGVLALYALSKFWAALRMRVVVDDTGMSYNRRLITWESMLRLRTDQYQDKAWVDLDYRDGASERSLRLDSLMIQRFAEIMQAICERKGFILPSRSSGSDESDASATR
jgi:hypothetical protein